LQVLITSGSRKRLVRHDQSNKMDKTTKAKLAALFKREAGKPSRREKRVKAKAAAGPPKDDSKTVLAHRIVAAAAKEAKSSFVSISAPDAKGDVKTVVASPSVGLLGDREYARTMLGMKPIRAQLVQEFSFTAGSANTVFNTVFPADIALAIGISSWINLFDEMRMTSIEGLFLPLLTSTSAGASVNTGIWPWTIGFDPDESPAVSSSGANIQSTRHLGPLPSAFPNGTQASPSGTIAVIQAMTEKGHLRLASGPLMKSVLPPSSGGVLAPNPVQGAWVPTTTSSAVGGYWKFYVPPLGPSIAFGTYAWFVFDVEFRMRG